MASRYRPPIRLGILGAGQLARLMCLEASAWGFECSIFANSADEPASQVTSNLTVASPVDLETLHRFVSSCDFITFESEFFPLEPLLSLPAGEKSKFFPSLDILAKIQHRDEQKKLLESFKISTAAWKSLSQVDWSRPSDQKFLVFKKNFGGYDGYGTRIFSSVRDAEAFALSLGTEAANWIAEEKIPFRRELAISLARNKIGDFSVLPLVESFQKEAQCDLVVGPTSHPALSSMIRKVKGLMNKLNYAGLLSLEFFDHRGQLVVNEIAPRVHNTAHHSLDSCSHSQFLLHALCCSQGRLPQAELLVKSFVMANLVGSEEAPQIEVPDNLTGRFYLYGKKRNRPRRKMGHLTLTGKNKKALVFNAKRMRGRFVI